jgi:AcrR family transcriptional regulator
VRKRPDLLAGEQFPAEPQQRRSLEKRSRWKASGLALFADKGYERTSIEELARHAKLAVGGFYLHFGSKRQLLLLLMDELLEKLSRLDLQPGSKADADVQEVLRRLLSRAFSHDLRYLGAYRAWQEAVLSDSDLAEKQTAIRAWTTGRVAGLFDVLQRMPGARQDVDISGLARVMDSFFWSLLGQAALLPKTKLKQSIDSATHLIYHALFTDSPFQRQ